MTAVGRNRPSPEQRTVTAITVAASASAVNKEWLGRFSDRTSCLVCSSSLWLFQSARSAYDLLNWQEF